MSHDERMNFLAAVILGIVEGATEFLPVSSTGHLILAGSLLHIPQTDFTKSFDIAIQLGAILAVVFLYWNKLGDLEIWKRLVVGFLPTAVIGLVLYKTIKTYLLGSTAVVLSSLVIGGFILIIFERFYRKRIPLVEDEAAMSGITYTQCVLIGLCQSIAVIPGVSRSAATILGGLALGLQRKIVVEFSFLLAIPTMLAATALDLLKSAGSFSANEIGYLAAGFIVSFLVAIISIKFFLGMIKTYDFTPFGIYRILIGLLFLLML
jgi:undecaprenyl-diphosphatase